jgi:hypothetical protein
MTVYGSLHSLLDYDRLLFCVTDLVLIYVSVTSELRTTNAEWRLMNELSNQLRVPFYNFGANRTEIITSNSSSVTACLFVVMETYLEVCYRATDVLQLLRA